MSDGMVAPSRGILKSLLCAAGLLALAYIAFRLGAIFLDFIQEHPSGRFQFDVFGFIFLVVFGPGTFALLICTGFGLLKRRFPMALQVVSVLSAIWVGYIYAALEAL